MSDDASYSEIGIDLHLIFEDDERDCVFENSQADHEEDIEQQAVHSQDLIRISRAGSQSPKDQGDNRSSRKSQFKNNFEEADENHSHSSIRRNTEQILEFNPDQRPPNLKMALQHAQARRVGKNRKLNPSDNIKDCFCPCCGNQIENDLLPISIEREKLGFLGSGVPLYFEWMVFSMLLCLILILCSIYPIIMNLKGTGCEEKNQCSQNFLMMNFQINRIMTANRRGQLIDHKQSQSNFLAAFCLMLATIAYQRFFKAIDQRIESRFVTPSHFTIMAENIPKGATDEEIKQFFEESLPDEKIKVEKVVQGYEINDLSKIKKLREKIIKMENSLFGREFILKDDILYKKQEKERIDRRKSTDQFEKRSEEQQKQYELQQKSLENNKNNTNILGKESYFSSSISNGNKVNQKKNSILSSQNPLRMSNSYEKGQQKNSKLIEMSEGGSSLLKTNGSILVLKKRKLKRGEKETTLEEDEEELRDIENEKIELRKKVLRIDLCVLEIGRQFSTHLRNTGYAFVSFKNEDNARKIQDHFPSNNLERFFNYLCCQNSVSFKSSYLKVSKAPEPGDILWDNLRFSKRDRIKRRIISILYQSLGVSISFGFIYGIKKFQTILKDHAEGNKIVEYLSLAISILTFVINILMSRVIKRLAAYEKPQTFTKYLISVDKSLGIAQFINSILISVIVDHIENGNDLMTKGGVILSIQYNVLINTFMALFTQYFNIWYIVRLSRRKKIIKQGDKCPVTQFESHKIFEGTTFNADKNYSITIRLMLVNCFVAYICPNVLFWNILIIFADYWLEKYLLLRRHAAPSAISGELFFANVEFFHDLYILAYSIGCMYWQFMIYDRVDDWTKVQLQFSVFYYVMPIRKIIGLCSSFETNPNTHKTYKNVQQFFFNDYDRANPATEQLALKEWRDQIEELAKKKRQMVDLDSLMISQSQFKSIPGKVIPQTDNFPFFQKRQQTMFQANDPILFHICDPTVSKKNLFSNMMDNPVSYNNPGINALLNLQRTVSVNADAQGNQNFFQKRFTTAKADQQLTTLQIKRFASHLPFTIAAPDQTSHDKHPIYLNTESLSKIGNNHGSDSKSIHNSPPKSFQDNDKLQPESINLDNINNPHPQASGLKHLSIFAHNPNNEGLMAFQGRHHKNSEETTSILSPAQKDS